MADIITQAEVQSVLETYNALGQRILGYRRRLKAGAFIEPGEYQAHDAEEQSINMGPTKFLNAYGLDIAPAGRRDELYVGAPIVQEELPYWVNETRDEFSYVLLLTDNRSDAVNDALDTIDLTRAEFIALKRHLAAMRGYAVPQEAAHA